MSNYQYQDKIDNIFFQQRLKKGQNKHQLTMTTIVIYIFEA